MIAPLAAEKGLSFAAYIDDGIEDRLHADDVCLRQILVNLLGNAVKFTDEGEITMSVSLLDDRLVISVTDTGPGISPGIPPQQVWVFPYRIPISFISRLVA